MLPVKCAIETLTASGPRSQSRLNALLEHFATAYGLASDEPLMRDMRAQADAQAARLPDFNPKG